MKAAPSIDFQSVNPTKESLVSFVGMLQKVYRNLALAVNNQILHFNGVPSGNPLAADLAVNDITGSVYVWFGGAWVLISGGGGGSGGSGVPGFDGLDADEPMMIPGAQGPQGNPGATGPAGPMGLGLDGLDGEDGIVIPPSTAALVVSPLWFGAGIAAALDPIAATVEPSSQSAIQTLKIGIPFTTGFNSAGYTVAKAGIYAKAKDGTNPQVQFAVYTDSAGSPSSLVCNSAADVTIGTVPGWVFGDLSSTTLTSATQYWVVFQFKGSGSAIAQTTGTFAKYDTNTYGTWPASFGAPSSGGLYSIVVALNIL